jgi:hypothetical protein
VRYVVDVVPVQGGADVVGDVIAAKKYAGFLETGTKKMAARPFLAPALEQNRDESMNALTAAVVSLLKVDATLASYLSSYEDEPAVFAQEPVPAIDEAYLPYGIVLPPITDLPRDTKTTTGRDIVLDIEWWARNTGSYLEVERIAERSRELLHRQNLTVAGYKNYITQASGPVAGPGDDRVVSRVVSVRFVLEKEA